MPNNLQDRILIVDDDPHMRSALSLSLKKTGMEGDIFASAEEALKSIDNNSAGNYFLILSDLNLPGMDGVSFLNEIKKLDEFKFIPFVIITAYGTVESAVSAMKLGAADYLLKPFDITDFERIIKNAEKISAMLKIKGTGGHNDNSADKSDFIYESLKMKEIDSYINITAVTDATVMITGESGTGKEIVAKRIHSLSKRKGKFIGVNCSAIVPTLLESELFGHEKGAFTGAVSLKKGKFEQADGGTILLDEIAEMDKNLQAKILRVLQEKAIDRVGGNEPVAVNARVIAATNKEIEKTVSEGGFRDDLFYRLNVIRLHLPPLRERKEDILPLAKYFMRRYAKKYFRDCKKITREAQDYLLSLNYPGNIRELENIMERAVILAQKDEAIDIVHFRGFNSALYNSAAIPAEAGTRKSIEEPESTIPAPAVIPTEAGTQNITNVIPAPDVIPAEAGIQNNFTTLSIKEMEEKLIAAALKETNGNRTKAAEKLGITSRTLRNKLKEYNLKGY
ncbi:MAG: sigma-54-dependent transcriptional regulator [bacterium]